jgi:hypothetical protein
VSGKNGLFPAFGEKGVAAGADYENARFPAVAEPKAPNLEEFRALAPSQLQYSEPERGTPGL